MCLLDKAAKIPKRKIMISRRMDKSVIELTTVDAQGDDGAYWATKTPEERLEALELMRQIHYNYDPAVARIERVLEIVKLEPR